MKRAIFGEIAWQAIDRAIVRSLRLAMRPIPTVDVGDYCHVSRICTTEQLRESLARLERQGLIRRTVVEVRDPDAPLLGAATFEAYEAAGVHHG